MKELSNPWLHFTIDETDCSFTLESLQFPHAKFSNSRYTLRFHQEQDLLSSSDLRLLSLKQKSVIDPKHGRMETLLLTYVPDTENFELLVEFALPAESPFLFQKMRLTNTGKLTLNPNRFVFAQINRGDLSFSDSQSSQTAFFSNGWQSWSPSAAWQYGQRQIRSRLVKFAHPMLYNADTPITKKPSCFSSDMYAALLDHSSEAGLLCGFLSQKEQFGSLISTLHPEPDLQVWAGTDDVDLLPGSVLESDCLAWQFFDIKEQHPFDSYFETVARENEVKERIQTPLGWCSWYYYFRNIKPDQIRENLQALTDLKEELPLEFFQIDDGFEKDVGTWLEFHQNFPEGLEPLVKEIKQDGFTPGLWLAPFILERNSDLIKKHPQWLLRKKNGQPANSGFVWEKFGRALDLTLPDVEQYLRKVIRTTVHEWGFSYLKLDFLYAAALQGQHHDRTLTRAQILRKGLEMIREEAGNQSILLGCGCPIGPGIGIFDMMRISADVSPEWEPNVYGLKKPFQDEPNIPCARNAINNILTRSAMDPHFWVNDPDCLLVREDSKLTLAEVQSLASAIALTGGALLLSDDMTKLNPQRLRIAQSLLPLLPPNPRVKDLFEKSLPGQIQQTLTNAQSGWELIVLFNWSDEAADLKLDLREWNLDDKQWLMREFWTGEMAVIDQGYTFQKVEAHGVRVLALRPMKSPSYLGSDLHISQGIELKEWKAESDKLSFTLNLDRKTSGVCYLWSDRIPTSVTQNGSAAIWEFSAGNIIKIQVDLDPLSEIKLTY